MSLVDHVAEYYSARASEYDATVRYSEPAASAPVASITARYQELLKGHDVLEVACGTGMWTGVVAPVARSIVATDREAALVALVRKKLESCGNLRCQVADAYTLAGVEGAFTAAFAQFWWSHMPKAQIRSFLVNLHSKLLPGALVLFLDDLPYRHSSTRRYDAAGDLLEDRPLRNGERFEIIKNFPTEWELRAVLAGIASDVSYVSEPAHGYWMVSYRAGGGAT